MLRRNSCKSQNHRPLSRSRSSVSVARNAVHEITGSEPLAAERDAYLAATISYNKTQTPHGNGAPKSPRLHRQQSVRFAGPNAQPQRKLATRASMATVGNAHMPRRPAGSQQLSQASYEPGDDAASLSFARLRKSRSMYSSSMTKTPNHSTDNGDHSDIFDAWGATPRFSSLAKKENEPFRGSGGPTLRTPKSMGFLSNNYDRSSCRASISSGHVSDQHAQGSFYEAPGRSTRLQSRPSSFFRSSHKYTLDTTSFPKSLRTSSTNTTVLSSTHAFGTSISNVPLKQPKLRTTARKISKSLKSRIKGLFSRSKSRDGTADQPGEHQQEVESNGGGCSRTQTPTGAPQEASLYRVVSHVPSFHSVPQSQQLRSRQGSLCTIEAEEGVLDDDKSRVTSWTNSTTATIANRPVSANWSHQYPSGFGHDGVDTLPSSHNQAAVKHDLPPPQAPIVNSQRVYSALMKRLQEKRNEHPSMVQNVTPDLLEADTTRSNSTIRRQARHTMYEGSTHTIRHVPYDDDVFQDRVERVTVSCCSSESSKSVVRGRPSFDSKPNLGHQACPSSTTEGELGASPSKGDMKSHSAAESQKRPLSSRSSAFFASPTCHLFRTTSPYRRALRESMKAAQGSDQPQTPDTKYLRSLSALSLPTRRPSTDGSHDDARAAYAESVYSDNSDEDALNNNYPSSPSKVVNKGAGSIGHGDATIFLKSEIQRPRASGQHARESSSTSSVEWKTWLSANVSKLETPPTTLNPEFPGEASSAPQTYGHVREKAEIGSDGDESPQGAADDYLSPRLNPREENHEPPTFTAMARAQFNLANPWQPQSGTTNENAPPASGLRPKTICSIDSSPVALKGNLRTIPSMPNVSTYTSSNLESSLEVPPLFSTNTLAKSLAPLREETRLKRQSRARLGPNDCSAKSSPGFTTALERQFGVSKMGSPGVWKSSGPPYEADGVLGSEADPGVDELGRRELGAQAMGSRRMVDLFLSSRRKRSPSSQMRQSSDTGSMSGAFI
ncbi:uncharacterized protein TRIREDRAFT_110238 [Trichoderma reesei QM6a]|uniref:Predicted protein n=2 Tax=Hypocrea jecorina TaxID=51453 RepID=G0RRK2_HYPJQ|nr:uncharacterized protein TRIREDRAFT_110238 [Trichoderma reesei QM6a]EGR46167.1 predicted protein [Trichoderma reesei QM6a]ETR99320.1 hypothetical protein M419DRAFT_37773 [Trichoderma reesei RUT C-30]